MEELGGIVPIVGFFEAALSWWLALAWVCEEQPANRNCRRDSGVPDVVARDGAANKAYESADANASQQPKQTFEEAGRLGPFGNGCMHRHFLCVLKAKEPGSHSFTDTLPSSS